MGKLKFKLFLFSEQIKKNSSAYMIALALLLAYGSVCGQVLTLKQYLASSLSDPYYKSFDAQQSFLNDRHNYALPWIDQLQFRYQDNQLNNYQTRYGIRFNPVNPWQIRNNNQYFKGIQTLKVLEQKMALKGILRERYDKVVEYWMATELVDLTLKQKLIREQIGNTMGKKAGSSDFDTDQYLNAQLDIISKEADYQEANLERDVWMSRILTVANAETFDLSQTSLITIDQINQLIQTEAAIGGIESEYLKQRVEISNQKMKLEKSDYNVGYLQTLYGSNRDIGGRNSIGVAFGVTIPIFNSNKENVAREKMDAIERQGEFEQFQLEEKNKRSNSVAFLKLHLNHYKKVDSLVVSLTSKGLNLLTGLSNNYDPIVELKYREKLAQLDILKAKIRREILLQYISFLDNSDKLHQWPLVNYLSNSFERIE
jgi:hypothetical protein